MGGGEGGGIASSLLSMVNCIVWDNHAATNAEVVVTYNGSISITYSDIKGGWSGTGLIDADPMFVNPPTDLHLDASSPCIDTADPNSPLDPDGTRADMGAFYYDQGLVLTVGNLVAGQMASIQVANATGLKVFAAYSLVGGGPTSTPWGTASLSPPWTTLSTMTANGNGVASSSVFVPTGATGVDVWIQAFDWRSQTLTNGLALTVQ